VNSRSADQFPVLPSCLRALLLRVQFFMRIRLKPNPGSANFYFYCGKNPWTLGFPCIFHCGEKVINVPWVTPCPGPANTPKRYLISGNLFSFTHFSLLSQCLKTQVKLHPDKCLLMSFTLELFTFHTSFLSLQVLIWRKSRVRLWLLRLYLKIRNFCRFGLRMQIIYKPVGFRSKYIP